MKLSYRQQTLAKYSCAVYLSALRLAYIKYVLYSRYMVCMNFVRCAFGMLKIRIFVALKT